MSDGMKYQGVAIRAIAFIIDNLVLFASLGLFHFLVFGTWWRHVPDTANMATFFVTDAVCLSFLAIYFLYFVVMEGMVGATIGKLICKIRVKKGDGSACGISGALIRNLLRIVDGLVFNMVGIVLIIASAEKQRLGDIVAKTVVVKA